jgi:ankyrin repeat protein
LHEAVDLKYREAIEALTVAGADVNARNNKGETPLYAAIRSGRKDIAKLLITKGASLCRWDNRGSGPQHQAGTGLLHIAVEKGNKDLTSFLIANGASVHEWDDWGREPLHIAAFMGHKDIAELLIAKGAKVNATEDDHYAAHTVSGSCMGETPLHDAVRGGHKDIAELLIANGAQAISFNRELRTPFNLAVELGKQDLFGFLKPLENAERQKLTGK